MKMSNLAATIQAAHWSYLVDGEFQEPGGLMLVAPPGSFKTTLLRTIEKCDGVIVMSDVNVPTMNALRTDIAYGKYRTLVFTELEKIYQRDPSTALNIEGHLRGFIDEGFRHASYEDHRIVRKTAKCSVLAAVTSKCYEKHFSSWNDSGFSRRFLMIHYGLANPSIIHEYIHRWERVPIPAFTILDLTSQNKLPFNLTPKDNHYINTLLPNDSTTDFTLLKKITCVLKHKYPNTYLNIISDVAPCFKTAGDMEIDDNEQFNKSHNGNNHRQPVQQSSVRLHNSRTSQTSIPKRRVP